MLIRSYGLFWDATEIEWNPGKGKGDVFRLLGRRGTNLPGLRVADFRYMQGIYILYGNHGPHYVGLTRRQGLGKRLKDHLSDDHGDAWNRFTWFGFQKVLERQDEAGIRDIGELAAMRGGAMNDMIGDIEALLIRAMGLTNKAQMNFADATEWEQIKGHEVERYLEKIAP